MGCHASHRAPRVQVKVGQGLVRALDGGERPVSAASVELHPEPLTDPGQWGLAGHLDVRLR